MCVLINKDVVTGNHLITPNKFLQYFFPVNSVSRSIREYYDNLLNANMVVFKNVILSLVIDIYIYIYIYILFYFI